MTPNAQRFKEANAKSPVVFGAVTGPDGAPTGIRYTLANRKTFELTRDEARDVGYPNWKLA